MTSSRNQASQADLYTLLGGRSMCRAYLERNVPHHLLLRVLEAARRTPSAGHAQGVRFGVLSSARRRRELALALGEQSYTSRGFPAWLSSAPVHLLIGASQSAYQARYSEPDKVGGPLEWVLPYDILDGGKALMALYLAAQREGLACGYLGPHQAETAVRRLLPWPQDWRFLGLVTLGYRDHSQDRASSSARRGWRDFDSVVQWWDDEQS